MRSDSTHLNNIPISKINTSDKLVNNAPSQLGITPAFSAGLERSGKPER